ncbi:hypothetical protein BS47DRAFT_1368104 [Hydnum rufescens UP504]|uniref:Uncharacterized protein n=1 Tax=Hydnum rufescens UP504 TaxID=1448309 RepID=A0A9P6AIA6_9AGAM|nr:hypothetical protein BS47DRAFT_1368104 [Hydnum rufescens UP504]
MNPRTSTRQNQRYPRKGGTTHPLQWGCGHCIALRSTDPHEPHTSTCRNRTIMIPGQNTGACAAMQDPNARLSATKTTRLQIRCHTPAEAGPFPKRKPARRGHRRAPNTIFDVTSRCTKTEPRSKTKHGPVQPPATQYEHCHQNPYERHPIAPQPRIPWPRYRMVCNGGGHGTTHPLWRITPCMKTYATRARKPPTRNMDAQPPKTAPKGPALNTKT